MDGIVLLPERTDIDIDIDTYQRLTWKDTSGETGNDFANSNIVRSRKDIVVDFHIVPKSVQIVSEKEKIIRQLAKKKVSKKFYFKIY